MLGHSTLPNMFTGSRSATTIGERLQEGVLAQGKPGAWRTRRDSPILMGLEVSFFLRCWQRRVRVSQRADGGGSPREMHRNTLVRLCGSCRHGSCDRHSAV